MRRNRIRNTVLLASLLLVSALAASTVYALGGSGIVTANRVNVNVNSPYAQEVCIPNVGQLIMESEISRLNSTTAVVGIYNYSVPWPTGNGSSNIPLNGTLVGKILVSYNISRGGVESMGGVISENVGKMSCIYPAVWWGAYLLSLDKAIDRATTIALGDSRVRSTVGDQFNVLSGTPNSFNSQTDEIGSIITLNVSSANGHFSIVVDLSQGQVLSVG